MNASHVLIAGMLLVGISPPASREVPAPAESSFVNTSFEADESLRSAREQIARGDWAVAAASLQNVTAKFGDRVIRESQGRYVGVSRYVRAEIASWPKPGLEAYRRAFEPVAASELDRAMATNDTRRLVEIGENYFCTRAGAKALLLAGESAMEAGDFEFARQWLGELLEGHPDRVTDGESWRTLAAVCTAWSGNLGQLQALVNEHSEEADETIVTWGGKRRTLSAFRANTLAALKAGGKANFNEEFSSAAIFCGGPDRRALYHSRAVAEAALWKCCLYGRGREGADRRDGDEGDESLFARSVQSGRWLTSSPAFGGGRIYVAGAGGVWAIDANGSESPTWHYELAPDRPDQRAWIGEDEPPAQQTVTFDRGRVFAHLSRESGEGEADPPRRLSALVCLDAASGRLVWKNELSGLASNFEELEIDGAPIPHRDRLYTVVRKRKGFGFEACLLVCLEPDTGRLVWSTHVGEAATGTYGYSYPTRTHCAAAGDRIYLHSNLGTVAAVGATTGRVAWLGAYPSRYADSTEAAWPTRFGRPLRAWQYQPTMLWRDSVLCAPMDCDDLLVLDASTGKITKRIPMDRLLRPESLLGLRGDLLYAAGTQVVCFDLSKNAMAWQRPLAMGQPFGRGALTETSVYIPTPDALLRYPIDGGVPEIHRWKPCDAGNILPVDDQVVVVSAECAVGMVARDEAFARLERRMREAPDQIEAVLALAGLAFAGSEDDRGLRAVDEARQRMTRAGGELKSRDQALIFDRLLRFANEISMDRDAPEPSGGDAPNLKSSMPGKRSPARKADRIETIVSLLKRAGSCAPDILSGIVCKFMLARACLQKGDAKGAIEIYQELLANHDARNLRTRVRQEWSPDVENPAARVETDQETSIYIIAERWIDFVIQGHGIQVYAAVEARAASRLTQIRQDEAPNTGALLELAREYPNSAAATDALLLCGRWCFDRGDQDGAIKAIRRAFSRRTAARPPEMLALLARLLMDRGDRLEARLWLERGQREFPDGRNGDADDERSLAEMLASMDSPDAGADREVPVIRWPLKPGYRRLFTERVSILSPADSSPTAGPWDMLLSHASGAIEARSPAAGRSLWPRPAPCPTLPLLLAQDEQRLYFAAAHHLFALTRTSGQTAWKFGEEPKNDAMEEPEQRESWTDFAAAGGRLFAASDRGDLICLSSADGSLRWRKPIEGGAVSHLAADAQFAYCAKWRGRNNILHVFDAATGESLRQVRLDDSRPVQMLRPAPEGALLLILAKCIVCVEPRSGEIRWSVATPNHFLVSTFLADVDGFIISDDSRRVVKHEFESGRELWSSGPVGKDDRDGLWVALAAGRVVVASRDALIALDAADGRVIWTAAEPAALRLQAPLVTSDSVLSISVRESFAAARSEPGPMTATDSAAPSIQLSRISLEDGRPRPMTADGPLVTEGVNSFGGIFVRNRAILLLDGERLISYVGGE